MFEAEVHGSLQALVACNDDIGRQAAQRLSNVLQNMTKVHIIGMVLMITVTVESANACLKDKTLQAVTYMQLCSVTDQDGWFAQHHKQ